MRFRTARELCEAELNSGKQNSLPQDELEGGSVRSLISLVLRINEDFAGEAIQAVGGHEGAATVVIVLQHYASP
jgi:hypothetical protein